MQNQRGGSPGGGSEADAWTTENVSKVLNGMQALKTKQEEQIAIMQQNHTQLVGELRVTDHLINASLFMFVAFFGYVISVHFTPTRNDIGGR